MYIDKDDFTAWMERIMDRFDMQDKKMDKVIKGRNCLDGEELLDNQDLCLLLKVAPRTLTRYRKREYSLSLCWMADVITVQRTYTS